MTPAKDFPPPARGRRPYVRTMEGWWRHNPFFVRYMAREATALAVLVYALVLMVGVVCLSLGEPAWNAWLGFLRTPWALALHLALLVSMIVHAYSWFEIMPKTMPMIFLGGHRLEASTIRRSGWGATVAVSVALWGLVGWWAR